MESAGELCQGFPALICSAGAPGAAYDLNFLRSHLRQHRTIASATFAGSFAPILQFEKLEIHTVFLRFPNFILEQNLSSKPLAELCGVAIRKYSEGSGPRPLRNSRNSPPGGIAGRALSIFAGAALNTGSSSRRRIHGRWSRAGRTAYRAAAGSAPRPSGRSGHAPQ